MTRARSSLVVLLGLALALGGCDAIEREQTAFTEMLLVDAGFEKIPAGREQFAGTAPREVVARTEGGRTIYLYKDLEHCGCIYVGGPEAEARYREALKAEAIARGMTWNDL